MGSSLGSRAFSVLSSDVRGGFRGFAADRWPLLGEFELQLLVPRLLSSLVEMPGGIRTLEFLSTMGF